MRKWKIKTGLTPPEETQVLSINFTDLNNSNEYDTLLWANGDHMYDGVYGVDSVSQDTPVNIDGDIIELDTDPDAQALAFLRQIADPV